MTQRTTLRTPARGRPHPVRRRQLVRVPAPTPPPVEENPPSTVETKGLRRLAWALLVLLVAVVAGAGFAVRYRYDQSQLDTARQQAVAAARQTTVNFVSVSASTVDADLRRVADGATGQFKDEFNADMAQIRTAVLDNKVDSHGTVLRAAVVSAGRHSAVVLVAVDATVKNTNAPDGRLSHYRIQVSLTRDAASGRWLVTQLQFVG